ncbi:NADPH:quinone reductase [Hydrogenophaga sp. OTU3427]|uniref:NADPH:quinone reductase n=1 Tax=Hydrogenophaga sp. OTU3427 TaxID=3043856 RepID=UPI00313BE360
MRAAWYTHNGEAREVLEVGDLPDPVPGPGEVRVRLATSGVNPSDVKSRRGRPLAWERVVPHSDGAGVIDAVGAGVPAQRVGERVWVWNGQWQRPMGTAAERIVLPQAQAVALPEGVDFEAGACLGIPALTAVQALRLAGDVRGRRVLVTGAGNAVGHCVTQLAVARGAQVIATAGSAQRQAHARAAGAQEVIDYKHDDVAARVKDLTAGQGADVLIDMDFSGTAALLPHGVLRPHGQLVCYGSNDAGDVPVSFRALLWGSLRLSFFLVYDLLPEDRVACLAELDALLRAGRLRQHIGQRFTLDQIAAAHEAVEAGVPGNVVLTL